MSLQIVLAVALAAGGAPEPAICSGAKNMIEPDMQITESDLDRTAAVSAADNLKGMIERGELGGEFQFGFLNQLKIIQGHGLLQQAQSDLNEYGASSQEAADSTKALCNWLSKDGFWYD